MKPRVHRAAAGFTLIELMVGIALFAVLFMLAYPSYASFIRNAQVRTAAESVLNGLQLARAEAIRRNSNVRFTLTNKSNGVALAGGTDWALYGALPDTPTNLNDLVQEHLEGNASSNARVQVSTTVGTKAADPGAGMPATITFTGLGRLTTATTTRQIDITGATTDVRRLAIILAPGGDIRMCDPGHSLATNPQGCS
ncbi:GspH/FimT family pseudopilin [Variovorax sp. Root473]|jgi:type IV fimbrial biogenesis protein FimT|uniref:GspH/FimT family pseudopilin n=1 Tax=Variovorax sp. Root473 TaxID=1736541 RepID=UPI000A5E29A9|nr:GspH/FimT family pseudopilin [Variovorax sp. Root473]